MKLIAATTKLVATWPKGADSGLDEPSSIVWGDGRSATLKDFRAHELDTKFSRTNGQGEMETHVFPDIIADVTFDTVVQDWVTSGKDVEAVALDLKNPNATTEQIVAELYTFPIIYRANIRR